MKFQFVLNYHIVRVLGVLLFVGALSSCEKVVDIDLKEGGGKVVMYAFIQPDSALQLCVSKSVSILESKNYDLIQDAYIQVYRNGQYLTGLSFPDDTIWMTTSNISFSVGDSVSLKVVQSGEEVGFAKTFIPQYVPITKIDTLRQVKVDENGVFRVLMSFGVSFTEPVAQGDYYQLRLLAETTVRKANGDSSSVTQIVFPKTDKVFYDEQQGTSSIGNIDFDGLFNDTKINGQAYKLQFSLPLSYFDVGSDVVHHAIRVQLFHITSDYYSYLRSRLIADSYAGIPIFDPVKIPSNVSGGFGLVSGLAIDEELIGIR
jgi:hypothetical protein